MRAKNLLKLIPTLMFIHSNMSFQSYACSNTSSTTNHFIQNCLYAPNGEYCAYATCTAPIWCKTTYNYDCVFVHTANVVIHYFDGNCQLVNGDTTCVITDDWTDDSGATNVYTDATCTS